MKKLRTINPLSKAEQITWWLCRAALFIWGVWGMMHGYTSEFIQATFAIIFTHLWDMFQMLGGKSFITKVPSYLQTMLNVFLCFACVVGTTLNTRTDFTGIDLPEHMFAGYLATTGAFVVADIMQGEKKPIKVSVQALFSLGFGVALLVAWEFYEFTMDRLYGFVMQHGQIPEAYGLTDTMIDLMVGTAGCFLAMFIEAFRKVGYFGKGKQERRAAYKAERAEVKRQKMLMKAQEED
ncbi:MAG: hypothetical protein IJ491_03545 [Clostridia bacterium]|nr:hypothetical protein [Clostridia bacterium]